MPWERVRHSSQYAKSVKVLENLYRGSAFLRRQREAKQSELAAALAKVEEERLLSQQQLSEVEPIALAWAKKRYAQRQQQEKRIAEKEQDVAEVETQENMCISSLRSIGLGDGRPRFVVIGNGQSAAEIFSDLWTRFSDAEVSLIIKGAALRPSDDSPFVNEIFDPERVDDLYYQSPEDRKQAIDEDKGTNYGVVRLELLEHIYEQMYMQRIQDPIPSHGRCKIIPNRKITSVKTSEDSSSLMLQLTPTHDRGEDATEELACSHVFVATGYTRNAHQEILKGTRVLLPEDHQGDAFPVGRNYRVEYDRDKVDDSAGVWLQGCNESTHGVSTSFFPVKSSHVPLKEIQ
jgi:lysine/ornithine N-monooxygenase